MEGELNNVTIVRCKAYIIFVKPMRQIINFGSVTYKPKHYKLKSINAYEREIFVAPCIKYYNLIAVNHPEADRHIFVPIPFNFRWIQL